MVNKFKLISGTGTKKPSVSDQTRGQSPSSAPPKPITPLPPQSTKPKS